MKFKKVFFFSVLLGGMVGILSAQTSVHAQDVTIIKYYDDPRDVVIHDYYRKLLTMALDETKGKYGPFKVERVMKNADQRDAFRHLRVGDGVDVVCSIMSVARDWVLRAVKVPLSKGYIGYRLIMVTQPNKNIFDHVNNIKELNNFRLGQEYDWPDTQILKFNGIHVVPSRTYNGLFAMLANHDIDGFPRGIYEIAYEIKAHPHMHLAIADGIYLKYPQDFFFFVKKDNLALAKRIKEGLLAGKKDGRFDQLFKENVLPSIKAVHLEKRHAIELSNPQYYKMMQDSSLTLNR